MIIRKRMQLSKLRYISPNRKVLVTLRPKRMNNLHFYASFLATGENDFIAELGRFIKEKLYGKPTGDLM